MESLLKSKYLVNSYIMSLIYGHISETYGHMGSGSKGRKIIEGIGTL